jgi:hypothetical protein
MDKIKLDHAIEKYTEQSVIRAAITAIPWVGGPLDLLISSKGQKIVEKRILLLLEELKKQMKEITEEMINKEFLDSEEWFDLVIKALDSAMKTRSELKVKLYAQILKNAVIESGQEEYSPEEYMYVISELTPKEIEIASVIYKVQTGESKNEGENELQFVDRINWKQIVCKECNITMDDLPLFLNRIESTGLIQEIVGMFVGYGGGSYIITPSFKRLMEFLDGS